jgi:hypothetical protein
MWAGFAISFAVGLVQAVHRYVPYVPTIQLQTTVELMNGSLAVPISFSFASIGLFFLLNREVALGLWVFAVLNIVQRAVSSRLGLGWTTERALSVWSYNEPGLVHQSMGAMIVLVLGGMWVGRGHLKNVALKAVGRAREVDDSDEILSYRAAALVLLASLAVITLWLHLSGIPWLGIAVFLFFAFIVYMALTRVVVEGGVAMLFPPMVAPDAAVSAVGTSLFGPTGMVGLMFARVWANDILNFAMPHCANGLRMGQQIGGRRRWLFWAMLLAIIVGILGGIAAVLQLGTAYGAINLRPAHFIWLPEYIGNYAAERIAEPVPPSWAGWVHTGLGAVVMALLMLARRHLYWWPIHPLGYPISSVFTWMMTSAFLAWLLKGTLLRYGGLSAYQLVRPLFLGLIVGQFAIFGTFWLVDSCTGMVGNELVW